MLENVNQLILQMTQYKNSMKGHKCICKWESQEERGYKNSIDCKKQNS
jgi:hypothetical protein